MDGRCSVCRLEENHVSYLIHAGKDLIGLAECKIPSEIVESDKAIYMNVKKSIYGDYARVLLKMGDNLDNS